MAMLLGKKIGMTQVYDEAGQNAAGYRHTGWSLHIMQVKTVETDGYNAVQLGYDDVKESRRIAAAVGHAKKANAVPKRLVRCGWPTMRRLSSAAIR